MARKHSLDELTAVNSDETERNSSGQPNAPQNAGVQGARRAIGAVSKSFEKLKSQGAVEIDPHLIDPPMIRDRLEVRGARLEGLIEQIREHGQQIPILVRPHPTEPGRYQIAYGWRRTEAAKAIGISVRANVRELSDTELVVSQGQENSEREDLSFIEKAQYAANLEKSGFGRDTIMACLAIDKTTCSKLISTTKKIPMNLIEAIGPAPKAGRDRWVELATRLGDRGDRENVLELTNSKAFLAKDSDDRFNFVFSKLAKKSSKVAKATPWKSDDGKNVAKYARTDRGVTLTLDENQAPQFGDFVIESLPKLYAAYKRDRER